jgi:signal transduction histidine kinase
LIGRSILEQAQSEHHRTICQALIIAAEQGQPFGFEAVFRDKQGNTVWNHISGLPMFSSDGETIIGFRGVGLNITDRKMTEFALQKSLRQMEAALQELRRTQSQLVQSEKMSSLGQLVAGIAHEINNPTSFIYGNVNHAESYMKQMLDLINHYQVHYPQPAPDIADRLVAIDLEFVQEDFPKVIHSMRTGAERIQSIVSALQNFSRMDESEVKFANVHEGIDSTLMILSQRLNRTDGKLPIAVVKNYIDLPEINCYAGQLNQVFMNVLLNALDALDERDRQRPIEEIQQHPSQITITTSLLKISEGYGQQMVQIQIKDNGVGIPKTVRDRIFDPFFTTKPVGQGTGMGLAISYQVITEKHNGRLSCQSEPGQGTEFTILLPLNFNH